MKLSILLALVLVSAGSLAAQERSRSPHGDLDVACTTCHRPDGWTPVKISRAFNHSKLGFGLVGAHTTTACRACHQSLDFKGTPTTCASCHQDAHRGELGADCVRCHTPRSFLDRSTMAKAHQLTRFPLEGAHLAADCTGCHAPTAQGQLQFVARSTECVSCHKASFVAARAPDHVQGGFPQECAQCHSSTSWGRGRFNHDGTSFPLSGAHRAVGCLQCHTNARYRGTPNQCVACHQLDFNNTTSPRHTQVGFTTDCVSCHATTSWTTPYDHSRTQFALTGAHKAATCLQCHADGVYRGKPTTCVSCHLNDYNAPSTTPNHVTSGFPTDCTGCHTTVTWTGATFDHNTSQFPLSGAHRATTCAQCHADGVYQGKPTTCVSCHQTDYTAAVNPLHTMPSFVATCTNCHSTTAWQPSSFSHNTTAFQLTGMHVTAQCTKCHINGVYRGTATLCEACHLSDYTSAVAPNHVSLGWPQTCATCHASSSSTQAWDVGITLPSQYHTMFSPRHEHANNVCSTCHLTTVYTQSTCSTHHHPPSCTFAAQRSCD